VVADAWCRLAPGVRIGLTAPLLAEGTLRIECARYGIAGFLARHIQLPPPGEAIKVKLELRSVVNGVRWLRQFDSMRAESLQTFAERTYTEEAGPFRLTFRTDFIGEDLIHVQVGMKVLGVPVPRFCGPVVAGKMSAGDDDRSWRLSVDIRHVWFGSLCRYEGMIHAR
jgi:hypothetical protein